MFSSKSALVLLAVAQIVLTVPLEDGLAGQHRQLAARGSDVCSSGIYGELSPILKGFPIAVDFCRAVYPVACTSAKAKRQQSTTPGAAAKKTSATSKTTPSATTKAATTTKTQDPRSSAWSKCQKQPGNVISTICSCIQTPSKCKTTTAKTTTTTKSKSQMTTPTTTPTTTPSTTPSTTPATTPSTTPSTTASTTESTTASTTTSAGPVCTPVPSDCGTVSTSNLDYSPIFSGTGVRTDPNTASGNSNPGSFPPQTNNFGADVTDCGAVQRCANLAAVYSTDPAGSFDLHRSVSDLTWTCVIYYGGSSPSDFTTVDANVCVVYGYNAIG